MATYTKKDTITKSIMFAKRPAGFGQTVYWLNSTSGTFFLL